MLRKFGIGKRKGRKKNLPGSVSFSRPKRHGSSRRHMGSRAAAPERLKRLQALLWPWAPSLCPQGDSQAEGEACGSHSYWNCVETCGSWWGDWVLVGGGFASHSGLSHREDGDVVKRVSSEIRLSWFRSWRLLSDCWSFSFFFYFSALLRYN